MVQKFPICPHRVRKTPKQFSWLDHRLVRDRYIDRCSHPAAALYLFLVTVADAQGLSYYGDHTISERLGMDPALLEKARRELIQIGLIAYRSPLYQVLALDEYMLNPSRHRRRFNLWLKSSKTSGRFNHDRLRDFLQNQPAQGT